MDYTPPQQVEVITIETQTLAKNFENYQVSYGESRPVARKEYQVVLYIKPNCPYCKKVLNHLQDLGEKIPVKDVTDRKSEAYKELMTVGKKSQVPCLFINGKAYYESSWINKWLTENKGKY